MVVVGGRLARCEAAAMTTARRAGVSRSAPATAEPAAAIARGIDNELRSAAQIFRFDLSIRE